MSKGWTEERRRKQAERIRQTKPWLKSTGPRTKAGKERSKFNALKHGGDSIPYREYQKVFDLNKQFLKQVQSLNVPHIKEIIYRNELQKNMILISKLHLARRILAKRTEELKEGENNENITKNT